MAKFLTILLVITVSSCNLKDNEGIALFNGIFFNLQKGEKLIKITPEIKDEYLRLIDQKFIQIPLFRYIKHKEYIIFIGIPYNTKIQDLIKSKVAVNATEIQSRSDSTLFDYKTFNANSTFITEYSAKVGGNLVFIVSITKSKIIQDSLFNYETISHRIVGQD